MPGQKATASRVQREGNLAIADYILIDQAAVMDSGFSRVGPCETARRCRRRIGRPAASCDCVDPVPLFSVGFHAWQVDGTTSKGQPQISSSGAAPHGQLRSQIRSEIAKAKSRACLPQYWALAIASGVANLASCLPNGERHDPLLAGRRRLAAPRPKARPLLRAASSARHG